MPSARTAASPQAIRLSPSRHFIEPTAGRLLTVHNVHWTLDLVRRMRAAIAAGTFESLRREVHAVWA